MRCHAMPHGIFRLHFRRLLISNNIVRIDPATRPLRRTFFNGTGNYLKVLFNFNSLIKTGQLYRPRILFSQIQLQSKDLSITASFTIVHTQTSPGLIRSHSAKMTTTTEKPLGFGYQVGAGAIAGVSEVNPPMRRQNERRRWLTSSYYRFYLCLLTPTQT